MTILPRLPGNVLSAAAASADATDFKLNLSPEEKANIIDCTVAFNDQNAPYPYLQFKFKPEAHGAESEIAYETMMPALFSASEAAGLVVGPILFGPDFLRITYRNAEDKKKSMEYIAKGFGPKQKAL